MGGDAVGRRWKGHMTEKGKETIDKAKEWAEEVAGNVKDESEKSRSRDKVEGAMHKAKGRVKEAAGALTGDEARKAEGISEQTKGEAKQKKGHLRDLLE
jgi:uncharacterized protein YjbJ (UPF0337 family)